MFLKTFKNHNCLIFYIDQMNFFNYTYETKISYKILCNKYEKI
jgi:hypothetical protein